MYKLGKISCVISIFKKTILKNVHNRKIVRTNTYMNSLIKKSDCAIIFTNKQTSLVFQDFLSYPNQQLIKRP